MTTHHAELVLFIDAGTLPEGQYVDVIDRDWNPLEYGVLLIDAVAEHGQHAVLTMAEAEMQIAISGKEQA